MKNWIMWALLIIPWFSLWLIDAKRLKRYAPIVLFGVSLTLIVSEIAYFQRWWEVREYLFPFGKISPSYFLLGIFPVATMWILYFTYERFSLYFLTNVAADFLFAYPLYTLAEKFGYYELVRFAKWQHWLVLIAMALIIYAFGKAYDRLP